MSRRIRFAVPALAALTVLLCVHSASAADPNGTWVWKFSRNGQDFDLSLTLKADGEKLTGELSLPMDRKVEIVNGTFKNDEVKFETVFERDGNKFTSKYAGKVDGDTIKGKVERERNGQVNSRDWEAKREKK